MRGRTRKKKEYSRTFDSEVFLEMKFVQRKKWAESVYARNRMWCRGVERVMRRSVKSDSEETNVQN